MCIIYSVALWLFRYLSHWPVASPGGTMVKNPSANAGGTGESGLIPGLGRSPGEGKGNPLQYSCLGNSLDREPGELQPMKSQVGHD